MPDSLVARRQDSSIPTGAGKEKLHQQSRRSGRPALRPLPRSAPKVGWGLGLLLFGWFFVGVGIEAGIGGVVFIGALAMLGGTLSLCLGLTGLVDKADLAFVYAQERHAAWREDRDGAAKPGEHGQVQRSADSP